MSGIGRCNNTANRRGEEKENEYLILMIDPPLPCFNICMAAYLEPKKVPYKFVLMTFWKSSNVSSCTGFCVPPIPV